MPVVGSPNMNALTITLATTATPTIIATTIIISVTVPRPVSMIFCYFSSTNVIFIVCKFQCSLYTITFQTFLSRYYKPDIKSNPISNSLCSGSACIAESISFILSRSSYILDSMTSQT